MGRSSLSPPDVLQAARVSCSRGRGAVRLLLCLLAAWSLLACAADDGPELLEVVSVDPPALEAGAELRVEGAGFPEHTPGQLVLSGSLALPGEEPRTLSFTARVFPQSRSLIRTRLSHREMSEMLQGAAHGTFTGRVHLAFDAKVEGRPRLRGSSDPIQLDLFARGAPSDPERAQAFLEFLGLQLDADWTVARVESSGRAQAAGLQPGDRLLALDGVHLDELADFTPQPRRAASELLFVPVDANEERAVTLERADFTLLETKRLTRVVAWAVASCLVLLWVARPPRWLLWWAGRHRDLQRASVTSGGNWSRPNAPPRRKTGASPLSWASFSALFLVSCAALQIALRWTASETARQGALLGLFGLGMGLVVLSAFLLGGKTQRVARFSLLGAAMSASSAALCLVPVLIAVVARASELGTLRLDELNHAQGALPWEWALLSSPWNTLLTASSLLALVPMAGRRPPVEAAGTASDRATQWLRALEWTGTFVLLGLLVLLYTGVEPPALERSATWSGLLFGLKFALATQLLLVLRRRSGWLRFGEVWSLWGRRNLAMSLFAGLLLTGALVLDPRGHQQSLWAAFTVFFGLVWLFGALWSARRSWALSGRGSDPWI